MKVGLVAFSSYTETPSGCFGSIVAKGIPANLDRLRGWLESIYALGRTYALIHMLTLNIYQVVLGEDSVTIVLLLLSVKLEGIQVLDLSLSIWKLMTLGNTFKVRSLGSRDLFSVKTLVLHVLYIVTVRSIAKSVWKCLSSACFSTNWWQRCGNHVWQRGRRSDWSLSTEARKISS